MKTLPKNQITKHLFFLAHRLVIIVLVFCVCSLNYSAQTTCGSLTIDAVVTSDYNGQDVSCADSSDATICVNVLAGSGSYNYQWVGGPSGPTAQCYSGVDAGTYTVIVTDIVSGQVCFEDVIVNEPAPLTVFSFNISDPTCNTTCDGSGTAIVIGGTSPVNYLWGSGETGFTANNLCVGVNTLDVTDDNGCFFDTTFNINTPTAIYPNVVVTDVSCFGDCDGIVESFPSGGNGVPYQFSWVDNSTSNVISTTEIANGLCTGSYTVTVTDPNLCNDDTVVFVNTPTPIVISVDNSTDATCSYICDGTTTVSVSGGTLPYLSIEWFQGSIGSGIPTTFTGLTIDSLCHSTDYYVTVTDANGCIQNLQIPQISAPSPINISTVITDVDCNGNGNGTVDATLSGGTAPLTPFWTIITPGGGLIPAAEDQNTLDGGVYQLLVTDGNGCEDSVQITINEPDTITSNGIVTDISCYDSLDGAIDLTLLGGAIPYNITWVSSDPSFVDPGTQDLSNLDSGSYTITVIDDNGCQYDTTLIITKPAEIFANGTSTNVVCFGDADGTITLNTSNGIPTYTWDWTGPGGFTSTDESLTGLDIGTYDVTITDFNGCTKDTSFTITEPPDINISTVITDVDCNGNGNGTVDATLSGGTAPLTPFWTIITPGGGLIPAAEDQNTLDGGVYQLLVTDGNGCEDSVQITINEPDTITSNGIVTDISCYDSLDGAIDLTLLGGAIPYNITWVSSDPSFVDPGTQDLSNLDSGSYTITVIDDNGCQYDTTLIITKPAEIFANGTSTNVVCFGDADGTITLNTSNGIPTYTWDWTGPGGFTSTDESLTGLDIGTYDVTITDFNGCTKDTSFTITEPDSIDIDGSHVDVTCFGADDGSITIAVSGGFPTNNWSWTSTNTSFSDPGGNATNLTNLGPGTYTVTVTDANNCTKDTSFILLEPAEIIANGIIINLTCNANNTGQIDITPTGGSGAYLFDWDNDGTGDNDDTEDLNGLSQGTYCVGIIDQNQPACRLDTCITLTEPDELFANLTSITEISCADSLNGAIDINPSGGTIAADYTYDWDNDGTGDNDDTQDLLTIGSGTYCVTITDDNGCFVDTCVVIADLVAIDYNPIIDTSSCGLANGNINLTVTGGNNPLIFDWDNDGTGDNDDTEDLSGLSEGAYQLTVIYNGNDGTTCSIDTTFNLVDNPPAVDADFVVVDESCFGTCDGSITTTVNVGSSPINYNWTSTDPGYTNNGLASQFNLCSGDYYLTMTDANNCSLTDTFTITSSQELIVTEIITNVDCSGDSTGAIDITVTGGNLTTSPDYNYNWTGINTGFSATTQDINNLLADTYQIIVADDDGCTDTSLFQVVENTALDLTLSSIDASCGDSNGTVDVTTTGGQVAIDYTYSWTNSSFINIGNTATVNGLPAGSYTVVVTDDLGCVDSATVSINDLSASTITVDTIIHESCAGDNDGSITVSITVSPPPGTLSWTGPPGFVDPGGVNTTINNLSAGQYIATLIDGLGCQQQEVIDIIAAQALSLNSIVNEPTCFNLDNGDIVIFPSGGSVAVDYQYDWDIDGTGDLDDDQDQDSLTSGTYIVAVFDDNGCTISDTFNLSNPLELTGTVSSSFAACGANDGYVTSTISGGTVALDYTYSWIDQSTGLQVGNTDSAAQLPASCYELTVTDDNGCLFTDITCINNPTGPVITLDQIDSVSCFGGSNGNVFISVTGGTGSLSYNWQDVSLSPSHCCIEDLITYWAGTYSITVTDSLGCISGEVYTIPQPDSIIISGTTTNLTCNANSSGEIALTIIGGSPNYNLSWSGTNGFTSNLEDLNSLDTGAYIISGTDNNGCTLPTDTFNITQPDSIDLTLSSTQTACDEATGTSSITAAGGTISTDYLYYWINSSGDTISFTSTADSLDAGTYYANVYDDNGCLGIDSITISQVNGPVVSLDTIVDVLCTGTEEGSIFISVSGNASPFSFDWTGTISPDPAHQSNEDLDTWFAGTYSVMVTDTNGCLDSLTGLIIDQPFALNTNIATTDVLCNGDSTGSIDLTLTGGVTPYSYEWTNGGVIISTLEDPSNLPAGTYDLLATDSNSCTIIDQAVINENSILTLIGSSVSSTCGNSNGEVSVVASGGTVAVDYIYNWFDIGAGYPGSTIGTGNATETGLPAGAYHVIVSDDNGCTDSTIVTLSDVNGPVLTYVSTNILCFGSANGSIDLTVNGASPFTFSWVGPPPFTDPGTEDINGLDPGTYTVVVEDDNGCISTEAIDVNGPSGAIQVNSTITDLNCFNDASGEISIDIVGGTPPYQTSWSGPNGFTSSLEDLVALDSGQYILDVLDDNLCPLNGELFDLTQPDSIVIDTSIIEPTCGLADGQISVTVTGGTIAFDYTYDWDDLSTPSSNIGFTSTITGVAAGSYQITVADDNNCIDSIVVAISDLTGPILSAVTTDVDCVGDDDGTINLTITGSGSYAIDWDNDGVGDNDDTEDLIALAAGTYNVIVEDLMTGCIASLSVDINVANSMAISFLPTNLTCFGDSTGSIDATVSGGTPSYIYDWTLGGFTVSNNEDPSGLAAGNYLLTVTDDNGCDYTDSIEVFEPTDLVLLGSSINSTCGNANGEVSVSVSGGTTATDYSYSWFDIGLGYPGIAIGANNDTVTGLSSGSYHVIVTDDNSCVDSVAIAVSDANGPIITIDSTIDVLCFGNTTGEIYLSISGNGGFGFSWTGPPSFIDPGTEDLTGLEAGTYSVVVTDINGCTGTENIDITSPSAAININSTTSNLLCYGDSTGSIDLLITGGTPLYLTTWSGPNGYLSSNEDISNLDTGQYILNITDSNGCQLNGNTFTISQPDTLSINSTITYPTCNASDGQITVTVTGGTVFADYTYNWDDISTPAFGIGSFATITGIGAGNYEVTVTDDNNCTNAEVLSITNVNAPTLSANVTDVDCNGNSTGSIDLTISGSSSYTIDWDNDGVGDNDDTEDLSSLSAGTYSVIINDLSTGCIAALSVDVIEPGVLTISGISNDLLCFEDSSGSIDITISGGTLPFTYDWDNDGTGDNDDTEDLDSLLVGNYNLIIIDSNNCSTTSSYTIIEPTEITISALLADNLCFGDTSGSIDITVLGGNPNYSFEWSDTSGLISTTEDLSALVNNIYSLTVTDDSTCTKDTSFSITSPSEITMNVTVTNSNCAFSDGTASANVSGGTLINPDYIYDWDNDGTGDNDDLSSINSLSSGNYTLIVYDDNGCQADTTVAINIINGPTITIDSTIDVSCNGGNDGAIYTAVVGGTLPYNYIWNPGINQQSEDITGLAAGIYYLELIDGIGCVSYDTVTINEPTLISYSYSSNNANCNLCDGTATITASGGTSAGTYNYLWSSGDVGSSSDSLCSGIYSVDISDDLGCSITAFIGVDDSSGPLGETFVATDPSCYGSNDGSIIVSANGGVAPYSYYWLHDASSNNNVSGLVAGNYFVEMTDATGCTKVAEIALTNPAEITLIPMISPSNCGANDGQIDLIANGGSGSFSYLWSNSSTNSLINNLNAGVYSVTVTDANNCEQTGSYSLSDFNNLGLSLSPNSVSCFGSSDGLITSTITGAVGALNYNWLDNNGNTLGVNSSDISNISAGLYYLELTDLATGCTQYESTSITEPLNLFISIPNILTSSCNIACDGAATVVVSGGQLPYSFDWSNGESSITASSLCVGPSTVTVTDNNGCTIQETINIIPNNTLSSNYSVVDAACGSCDGQASVAPSGGSGNYTITWFDGTNGNSHANLCAGVYGYEIIDNNGCSVSTSITVNNSGAPNNATVNVNNVTCYNGTNGSASVIPSGGTPPYNYFWVPTGHNTNIISGLEAGTYHLEIEDANGCIQVVPVTIDQPNPINIQSVIYDANCGNSDGSVSLILSDGASPYSVSWDGPGGFNSTGLAINGINAGNYNAYIQDVNGCVDTSAISVNEINNADISLNITHTTCYNSCDGEVIASLTNGSGNYNYNWSNGGNNSTNTGLCAGLYSVVISDITSGCISSSYFVINSPDSISLSLPFTTPSSCNDSCNAEASIIPSGGTVSFTYNWSPSAGTSIYESGLCAGNQTVIVTDNNNCTAVQNIVILEPDPIAVSIDNITNAFCSTNPDGSIDISVSGGDGSYNYSWSTIPASSFSSTNEDVSNLLPTTYVVSILDDNNCPGSDTMLVDATNVLIADAGLDTAFCMDGCIVITGTGTGTSTFTLEWLDTLNNVVSSADTLEICSSDPSITNFILHISDQNCNDYDTISVLVNELPVVDAGLDIIELYGDIVNLGGNPTGPTGASYSWAPLSNFISLSDSIASNPEIELLTEQEYIVYVTDTNGCISNDNILVTPIPEIYFPTGFTPNGDGVNEDWQIDRIEDFPDCVVEIYNRWGELLFRSIGYNQRWDGIYKNKPLPVGTYYYVIELNHPKFPNPYTGPITIMR